MWPASSLPPPYRLYSDTSDDGSFLSGLDLKQIPKFTERWIFSIQSCFILSENSSFILHECKILKEIHTLAHISINCMLGEILYMGVFHWYYTQYHTFSSHQVPQWHQAYHHVFFHCTPPRKINMKIKTQSWHLSGRCPWHFLCLRG